MPVLLSDLDIGTATVIAAVCAALSALGVAWMSTHFGTKLKAIAKDAHEANRSVNHVEPGAPTLIQRVNVLGDQIRADRLWQQESMLAVARQVGTPLLPPPPELSVEREPDVIKVEGKRGRNP